MDVEFIRKIRSMLDKSKSTTLNMMRCIRALKENKYIRILLADKGISKVVLDDSEYLIKLNLLLESGVYEPLPKYPTFAVEEKVRKLLSKYSNALPTCLKHQLTPYQCKPPHLMVFLRYTSQMFL
jgi:hypothetical protein